MLLYWYYFKDSINDDILEVVPVLIRKSTHRTVYPYAITQSHL